MVLTGGKKAIKNIIGTTVEVSMGPTDQITVTFPECDNVSRTPEFRRYVLTRLGVKSLQLTLKYFIKRMYAKKTQSKRCKVLPSIVLVEGTVFITQFTQPFCRYEREKRQTRYLCSWSCTMHFDPIWL